MDIFDNYRFPELKGEANYNSWKTDVSTVLMAKGLWQVTSGELEKPIIPTGELTTQAKNTYDKKLMTWQDKNDQVCTTIILNTGSGPRMHIENVGLAAEIWAILETKYSDFNLMEVYLAVGDLIRYKQSDFKSVRNYAEALNSSAAKLSDNGKVIPHWFLSNIFLLGLNKELEPCVFILIQEAKANNKSMDINEMAIALTDYYTLSNTKEKSKGKEPRKSSKSRKEAPKCGH